jgi:hypothetical protein
VSVTFYDVKTRSKVEVPEVNITKTAYIRETSGGVSVTRYAFRGRYQGRTLTKFVTAETYEHAAVSAEA